MAAKCGQTGHVVAIEPDPYSREVLVRNIDLNPGIKQPAVEVCACPDEIGEATLFCRRENSQSSLARSAVESSAGHKPEETRVPLVNLDFLFVGAQLAKAPLRENRCGGSGNPYFERCETGSCERRGHNL